MGDSQTDEIARSLAPRGALTREAGRTMVRLPQASFVVFSSHIFLFYFLVIALATYYLVPRCLKHLVITLMSYVFYGWWNPWFTLLMLGSTVIDYYCGKMITAEGATTDRRKAGVALSVVANLSILGFFKYCGFAVGSASALAEGLGFGGFEAPEFVRTIVLPVGISFYTFQSMSYSIDLYRGHAKPANSFIDFACYVSMFPQLVAGPIVRYGSVAEQLRSRIHSIEGFVAGMTRFNVGFAKKILLADPMGMMADACFHAGDGVLTAPMAWLGITAYAFQIYFDFSGYSDMAIGLGRMFGFRFPENFDSPYKSVSITDFWRRWHISLSTFLRDYLYIPLGGNRLSSTRTYVNLMTVMLFGGLWHGAQWTFIAWGAIHGGMLAFERLMGKDSFYAKLPNPVRIAITFVIVLVTWVFFRAENFEVAWKYLSAMSGFGGHAQAAGLKTGELLTPFNMVAFTLAALVVWACPRSAKILEVLTVPKVIVSLLLLVAAVCIMYARGYSPFLYFQF
jgi:alginate O-acetyltransferase complex protein AlgI